MIELNIRGRHIHLVASRVIGVEMCGYKLYILTDGVNHLEFNIPTPEIDEVYFDVVAKIKAALEE